MRCLDAAEAFEVTRAYERLEFEAACEEAVGGLLLPDRPLLVVESSAFLIIPIVFS